MTEPAATLPDELRAALREAEAEVARARPEDDARVATLVEQAATVGAFDLAWLDGAAGGGANATTRSALLDLSEPVEPGLRRWRLRPERRRATLAALLADHGRLMRRLHECAPLPDDTSGRLLRAALDDVLIDGGRAEPPPDERTAALEVAIWLDGLGTRWPSPGAVRRAIARNGRIDVFEDVRRRFVGRDEQLDRLRAFADGPADDRIQVLPVSGVGGIGKSALLARFLYERLTVADRRAALIVHLDFDRAGLGVARRNLLDAELTRQIALAAPSVAPEMDRIRREARDARRSRSAESGADPADGGSRGSGAATVLAESMYFSGTDLLYEVGSVCGDAGLLHRPLLFVFDTMEELQAGSDQALRDLGRWIEQVRDDAQFGDVRVIACGRAGVRFEPAERFATAAPIVLDELAPAHAAALLADMEVPAALAAETAARYGGNPLTLRLVARLLLRPDASGLPASDEIDRELVQGMLYDRVLGHIHDARVRRLAHPGLVLRRVTPRLVREVIAPLCLPDALAPGEERTLFEALRREVWLVEDAAEPDAVLHRSDIRRVMMTMMRKDAARAADAERVHRAATAFYEGPGADTPHAAREALYHRFMVPAGAALPRLDTRLAAQAQAAIGTYAEELPRENLAALRVTLGLSIDEDEARLLPDDLWRLYVELRGRELVAREAYRPALALDVERPTARRDHASEWQLIALDAIAAWPAVVEARRGLPKREPGSAAWFTDMAALAEAALKAGGAYLSEEMFDAASAMAASADRVTLAAQLRFHRIHARMRDALGRTAQDYRFDYRTTAADLLADEMLAIEHVRYLQAIGRIGSAGFRPMHLLFYPSLPWLERMREVGGGPVADALAPLVVEVRGTDPRRLTTGRLLGHHATMFADALVEPFLRGTLPPSVLGMIAAVREHPEFRVAARVALGDVLVGPREVDAVLEMLRPRLPSVPVDLMPSNTSVSSRSELVTALVAFADRCQLLPDLLHAVFQVQGTEMLRTVAIALRRWRTRAERGEAAAGPG